jgi:hypothetical protein
MIIINANHYPAKNVKAAQSNAFSSFVRINSESSLLPV